ncbi:hypothetical protein Tco_0370586 [Tanacetum coccineum]
MSTTPHTTPIRACHDQYSNVFAVTRVAVNAVDEECLFARESCSVAADQHTTPLITNDIPVRTLHDTHVNTTERLKLGSGSSSNKQNISEGSGNVGYAIAKGGEIGSGQPQTNVEYRSVNVSTQTHEHTSLKVDTQSQSAMPSICDDVLAMEHMFTTPIHASHDQYSNVSVVTHVAVNGVDEECLFARDCCSVAADQHTDPLITNDIPIGTLHDTQVNTTERLRVSWPAASGSGQSNVQGKYAIIILYCDIGVHTIWFMVTMGLMSLIGDATSINGRVDGCAENLLVKAYPTSLSTGCAVGHDRAVCKSLIISLWFDPVDCHDYLCRGYHVISCVDLLFAIYLPKTCEVKYRQSQEVLVDIPERITEHGLSSENTQSSGGSSDASEGSEDSGSFEDSGR